MTGKSSARTVRWISLVTVSLLIAGLASAADTKLSVDELVAKHLESIGAPEARSAVRSRVAQGSGASGVWSVVTESG
jgi:hypothetical protein